MRFIVFGDGERVAVAALLTYCIISPYVPRVMISMVGGTATTPVIHGLDIPIITILNTSPEVIIEVSFIFN